MFLFTRRARLASRNSRGEMAWAVAVTEKANQITGLGSGLYSQMYGPEAGTVVWSAFVPDLTALEAASDKLLADNAFVALTDEGTTMLAGGPDDALLQVVHGEPDPDRPAEYVTAVQAVSANGRFRRGVELGVEIAQRVEQITGASTLFVTATTGMYAGVAWVTGFADAAEMERAQQALMTDTEWADFIDREAGTVYAGDPAMTTQSIYRHVT
jgi:hypothetical protein